MYEYNGKVVDIVDGDTIDVVIDIFPGITKKLDNARLYGIDTPEIRSSNPKEKELAHKATKYLSKRVMNKSVKIHLHGKGKWGRWLITVYYRDCNINKKLIKKGYGGFW